MKFPQVINELAPYGYQPVLMIKAIDRLLIDDRPERRDSRSIRWSN